MSTREVVEHLYTAYLAGDVDGMVALMDDDVEVRFLGQAPIHGRTAVAAFLHDAAGHLRDLRFDVVRIVVDGDVGAGLWRETATTPDGQPWHNHGIDVVHVAQGRIVALHENNDVRMVHRHLAPPADASNAATPANATGDTPPANGGRRP